MLHGTLNLGILAHVDAGKTTLTERLLYDAGIVDAPGSVDRGTTQTDTLELERERGITIRAAVVSFPIGDLTVNLIDTPGHPDFIAEVERSLAVLDGAVLVVSAVEGVQAQTLVLMRALERLRIPAIVFVNKTDRRGADVDRVIGELRTRLDLRVVPLWDVRAEQLADHDDALLAAFLDGGVTEAQLAATLAELTRAAVVRPVIRGSALTGEGVDELREALVELLPTTSADADAPVAAAVFKIERGAHGEKVAYVRMFGGTLRTRERVGDDKVTALEALERGGTVRRQAVAAGDVAKVWGLHAARVGDRIGDAGIVQWRFARPALEAVVEPLGPEDATRLRAALDQLAEQDPLIAVRHDRELTVSIYGEVQKQVLEATLARVYGIDVVFRETRPIYVERPIGTGEAVELLNAPSNPYHAQIGFRIDAAPEDSGVAVAVDVPHDRIPLYAFKRREEFERAIGEYVREALRVGRYGWEVIDCVVTMTDSWYSLADGPPSRRGPLSKPSDFHGLTPIVLAQALARAGTVVCEPILRFRIEAPTTTMGQTMAAAARLGATLETPEPQSERATLTGRIPALAVNELQRQLPGLTHGEGTLESAFAGYRAVEGDPPVRDGAPR